MSSYAIGKQKSMDYSKDNSRSKKKDSILDKLYRIYKDGHKSGSFHSDKQPEKLLTNSTGILAILQFKEIFHKKFPADQQP